MARFNNLLLVYPKVPNNTYWSYKYTFRLVGKKSAMPPLGLITLAALIPEGYQLKLVDMNVSSLEDEDILWSDAVMISAMHVQQNSFHKVVNSCNRLGRTVIAGGPYASSDYEKINGVDHFVLGEVEDIIADFLTDLNSGNARKVYVVNKRPDISRTVIPRFDLLDLSSYATMSIQYSRGCPFKCDFCNIWKYYGNRPRLKAASNLTAELDALYEQGWRGPVFIVDDNFIGNKKRVKNELLPALINWQQRHDYVYQFFTEATINMADDRQLLAGMRDAKFNEVFIGIETPSAASLKESGKHHNLKGDLNRSIRRIQRYGMEVMAGFILGFDNDTPDIFDRQIEFIRTNAIPRAMVGLLQAPPGTDLYSRLEKEGRILNDFVGNNTHQHSTNFITKMDATQLREGYLNVLASLYDVDLKDYFNRCNQLFDNLGDTRFFQRAIGLQEIKILSKSLVTQPFTRYGLQYLKFIVRNLIKHSDIWGETIRFAIIGHHFHTITRETLKSQAIASELDANYLVLREQLGACLKTMKVNSQDAYRRADQLWAVQKKSLRHIRDRIDRIHEDFRGDIVEKYSDISKQVTMLFNKFPGVTAEQPTGR